MRQRLLELGAALASIITAVGGWALAQPPTGQAMDPPHALLVVGCVILFAVGVVALVLSVTPKAGRRLVAHAIVAIGTRVDPDSATADRRMRALFENTSTRF